MNLARLTFVMGHVRWDESMQAHRIYALSLHHTAMTPIVPAVHWNCNDTCLCIGHALTKSAVFGLVPSLLSVSCTPTETTRKSQETLA